MLSRLLLDFSMASHEGAALSSPPPREPPVWAGFFDESARVRSLQPVREVAHGVGHAVRIPAARRRTARQPGRCRCRTAKNSAGGEPAPRLPFGTTHDPLPSLVLAD